jgi:hypothetical protein
MNVVFVPMTRLERRPARPASKTVALPDGAVGQAVHLPYIAVMANRETVGMGYGTLREECLAVAGMRDRCRHSNYSR